MLSDRILGSKALEGRLGSGFTLLSSLVRGSHRFVLGDGFRGAVEGVATNPLSRLARMMTLCRPSYQYTWIETPCTSEFKLTSGRSGIDNPTSSGILIQDLPDRQCWIGDLFWEMGDGHLETHPYSLVFDYSGQGPADPSGPLFSSSTSETADKQFDAWFDGLDLPASTGSDLVQVAKRCTVIESELHSQMSLQFKKRYGLQTYKRFLVERMPNSKESWLFWLSTLALLNSRNVATYNDCPDLTRANKRRSRGGKKDLLTYKTCVINNRLTKSHVTADQGETDNVRFHFVRGHFKIRKSGLYWWRPFGRGNPDLGVVRKDYAVSGSSPGPRTGDIQEMAAA